MECFVEYKKAFDRVNHGKLIEVVKRAGILELGQRLIIGLYWNQYATVKTPDQMVNQGKYTGSEEEYDRVVLFHPYCSISILNT